MFPCAGRIEHFRPGHRSQHRGQSRLERTRLELIVVRVTKRIAERQAGRKRAAQHRVTRHFRPAEQHLLRRCGRAGCRSTGPGGTHAPSTAVCPDSARARGPSASRSDRRECPSPPATARLARAARDRARRSRRASSASTAVLIVVASFARQSCGATAAGRPARDLVQRHALRLGIGDDKLRRRDRLQPLRRDVAADRCMSGICSSASGRTCGRFQSR